jgi:hypothetical protein
MQLDHFNGRPWCQLKKVSGDDIDELFDWINANDIDGICQGITQGGLKYGEDTEWYSVWSFGTEQELLLFVLRFSQENS